MTRHSTTVLIGVVIGVLGLASCGGGGGDHDHADETPGTTPATQPAFAEDDATTKLDVVLQDYAFVGVPESVAGENVLFRASIKGGNTHELEIVDENGEAVGEIAAFKAPAEHALAVVLEAGTYTLQCLIEEGSRTHAQLGMKTSFTVI